MQIDLCWRIPAHRGVLSANTAEVIDDRFTRDKERARHLLCGQSCCITGKDFSFTPGEMRIDELPIGAKGRSPISRYDGFACQHLPYRIKNCRQRL